MSGLRISVAMCTYNGARFLQQQLQSIAAQSRLPDELIICDDCSTDGTVEIIDAFVRRACFPVRVLINEGTLGATKNFEKAIALCQCEIIVLADQDDVWLSPKLECIADIFMRWPETVAAFSDADIIDEASKCVKGRLWETFFFGRKEQKRFANGQALNVLLKHPVVTGATMAFREEFRRLVLPMPAHHAHDYWMSILLSACGDFRLIPDALIQYRQHASQKIGLGLGGLTLMERAERAFKDGRESYFAEYDCFTQACKRLEARKGEVLNSDVAIKSITQKIAHRSVRRRLPKLRLLRLPTVLREVVNRGYWNYSEGWKSVARDLFL
jgi:glycosyltransferase involved in cell wall biosynthesis